MEINLTPDVVLDAAETLGIDPAQSHLLAVAKAFAQLPLPTYWKRVVDAQGKTLYLDRRTAKSSVEHPQLQQYKQLVTWMAANPVEGHESQTRMLFYHEDGTAYVHDFACMKATSYEQATYNSAPPPPITDGLDTHNDQGSSLRANGMHGDTAAVETKETDRGMLDHEPVQQAGNSGDVDGAIANAEAGAAATISDATETGNTETAVTEPKQSDTDSAVTTPTEVMTQGETRPEAAETMGVKAGTNASPEAAEAMGVETGTNVATDASAASMQVGDNNTGEAAEMTENSGGSIEPATTSGTIGRDSPQAAAAATTAATAATAGDSEKMPQSSPSISPEPAGQPLGDEGSESGMIPLLSVELLETVGITDPGPAPAIGLPRLRFYSWWYEDIESCDLTWRVDSNSIAGGGLKRRYVTLDYDLESATFSLRSANEDQELVVPGILAISTKTGAAAEVWDLHVGATFNLMGKPITLLKAELDTAGWNEKHARLLKQLRSELLAELQKYKPRRHKNDVSSDRGDRVHPGGLDLRFIVDQIYRLAAELEEYRPSLADKFRSRISIWK